MNIPSLNEIILLLLGENSGQLRGKTNVHKNIYLSSEMLKRKNIPLPCRFRPYFYGPFSSDVSNSLDILLASGLVASREVDLGAGNDFEIKQTVYSLTDAGRNAFRELKSEYDEFAGVFSSAFRKISSTGYHQNTKCLATAAKIKHIISGQNKPVTIQTIKDKATGLGWQLRDREIDQAITVLEATGLASRSKKG